MAGTHTLAIIKPDAFERGKAGKIIAHLEAQGFVLRAARVMRLTRRRPASSTPCTASGRSTGSWWSS
jgi:nucleoside diphosphate kinase